MKRYCVKYMNKDSQTTKHETYCVGESDLHATVVDLVVEGNFIDWIGEKDESNTIGHYEEISRHGLLKVLGIDEKNQENEDAAYEAWGLY